MKNNKNLISFVFGALLVVSLGVFAPKASAYTGFYLLENSSNSSNNNNNWNNNNNNNWNNNQNYSSPIVYSVNPNSLYSGTDASTITVNGSNFNSDSIVVWDNTFLPTTYYNSGRLTAVVNRTLLTNPGNHTISVFNPNYGGGTSNGVAFSVIQNPNNVLFSNTNTSANTTKSTSNTSVSSAPKTNSTAKASTAKSTNSTSTKTTLSDGLGANALSASVIGSKTSCGFMPSTLLQWLILIFLILIFVMLVRKAFFEKEYLETPLKHD